MREKKTWKFVCFSGVDAEREKGVKIAKNRGKAKRV